MTDGTGAGEAYPQDAALIPVGPQVAPGNLALWRDPETAGDIAVRAYAAGELEPLTIQGPFELAGHQLDGATAAVMFAAGGLRRALREAGPAEVAAVPISMETAMADPGQILGMIRTAPRLPFQERVQRADRAGFKATFERYRDEGIDGLLNSLLITRDEEFAYTAHGFSRRKARNRNKDAISDLMRTIDLLQTGEQATANPFSGSAACARTMKLIMRIDGAYVSGQPGAEIGRGSVSGSPQTRERIERLMALRYNAAIGERGNRPRPDMTGAMAVADMHGGSAGPSAASQFGQNPELLRLQGIRDTLDAMWTEYGRQQKILLSSDEGVEAGEQQGTGVYGELLDLEALLAALQADARVAASDTTGALMGQLHSIVGMETTHRPAKTAAQHEEAVDRVLGLDSGGYGEEDFEGDVMVAGAAWKVISQLRPESTVAGFERNVMAELLRKLGIFTGGQPSSPSFQRSVLRFARAALTVDDYQTLAGQGLAQAGEAGALGALEPGQETYLRELLAGKAARNRDPAGRYGQQLRRAEKELAAGQHEKDFPPEGRMLCFYGDLRVKGGELVDGEMGVLEALGAVKAGFRYIDSAGNRAPMREGRVRHHLERLARDAGHHVEISEPETVLRKNYRSEAAHFVGHMPDYITPELVLNMIIPNGFATMGWNSNKVLIEQIRQLGRQQGVRFARMPTELVRFLHTPGGLTEPALGHTDPGWRWKEFTEVMFFDKEDGSPSDLYLEFQEQARRAQAAGIALQGADPESAG